QRRPRTSIGGLPARELGGFRLRHGLDGVFWNAHTTDHIVIHDAHDADAATGDGPMASSKYPGTPSLRTIKRSSGSPSIAATSAATGTPPRGPSTIAALLA